MHVGVDGLWRLALRTYFPGRSSHARLTVRRALVMSVFLPPFLFLQTLHLMCLLADCVLFPGFRRIEIARPLFLVGVPRSGTTFLHRLVAADEQQFTTFRLWELLLAPALSQKYFWLALFRLDACLGGWGRWLLEGLERSLARALDDIHPTKLTDPEEDYLALMPIAACFLLVHAFPFPDQIWRLASFDQSLDPASRRRVLNFYRSIVQRHLYFRGKNLCLLSKNPSFTPLVCSLLETFPDARIVCNLREARAAVPSLLSSMQGGQQAFANDPQGWELRDRFLTMLAHYYELADDYASRLPPRQFLRVDYRQLVQEPVETVGELLQQFGYEYRRDYADELNRLGQRSRSYRSRHHYDLAQFQLDERQLRDLFRDAY